MRALRRSDETAGPAAPVARRAVALATAALVALALPGAALGQSHFRLRPSLELVAGWDDNLLSTPEPAEEDWVGRAIPGLEATVTGPRSVFGMRYGAEAEGFMDHRDLSSAPAAQTGELWLDFEGARWTTQGRGSYAETNRPWELNLATGLSAQRIEGRRIEAHQLIGYRFGPRTRSILDYTYRLEELEGDDRGDIHLARAGFERRFSPRDLVTYSYTLRHFAFRPDQQDGPLVRHVLTLGWERRLLERTLLKLEAGPRFGGGEVDGEGAASLHHRLDSGEMGLEYSRTQTTILGESAVAVTDNVGASLTHRLHPRVTLYLSPGWFWTRVNGRDARVWRADAELGWQVAPYFLVSAGHSVSYERGDLGRADGGEVIRNLFVLRIRVIPAAPVRRTTE